MSDKIFLDKKEVAEMFCISEGMVNKLLQNNEIPYLRIGERVIFKKSELIDWILKINNRGEVLQAE